MKKKKGIFITIISVIAIILSLLVIFDMKSSTANIRINYYNETESISKIQGKIVNESKKPIDNAIVTINSEKSNKSNNKKTIEAKTDKNGFFEFKTSKNFDKKIAIKFSRDQQDRIIKIENETYTTQNFEIPNYDNGFAIPVFFALY